MTTQKQVKINNASIEQVGIPRDFASEIAEFIWNGFDAKATEVEIQYKLNEILGIESLSIRDNGEGIVYENIEKTFGILLDSSKQSIAGSTSYVHGKRGVGRYSFQHFAHEAEWVSIYKKDDKKYRFSIKISADNKEKYTVSTNEEVANSFLTGCTVNFFVLNDSVVRDVVSNTFIDWLRREYGWYLHLNNGRAYKLMINGKTLDYDSTILDSDKKSISLTYGKTTSTFELNYIEWKKNTGDKYYYNYLLDTKFIEKYKKPTSFNNNGINFHHSVFVVSDYFDHYVPSSEKENQTSIFDSDEIFKLLNKELHLLLEGKQKQFIDRNAEALIKDLEQEKVFPKFEDNNLGEERKKEFINITKSLFRLQPKLFINVGPLQKKSFLALLKLSVDSNERENILKIVDSIVEMTSDERAELARILEITSLSKIVQTMKEIIERIKNVEILRTLVTDHEKYTNERDNIQKIMEKCFWLFGEQYLLISADKTFTVALQKYYIEIVNKSLPNTKKFSIEDSDSERRPDLFLCRQYPLTQTTTRLLEDNVIIELKRPSVDIGTVQVRQIEDYMNFLINQSSFSGTSRYWKFYIVGNNLDKEVQDRVEEYKNKGEEQFLYLRVKNFAIFALNWDDLFQTFKLKANFILNKLDIKKEALQEELKSENVDPKDIPGYLTKIVLEQEPKLPIQTPITN